MCDKENLEKDKLLLCQQELRAEEEVLKKIISTIDNQIHALQVEQLDILNRINKSSEQTEQPEPEMPKTNAIFLKEEVTYSQPEDLDLSVPTYNNSEEDEEEMDGY